MTLMAACIKLVASGRVFSPRIITDFHGSIIQYSRLRLKHKHYPLNTSINAMKKIILFLLAALLPAAAVPLSAQDYRFAVPRNLSWVVIDFQGQAAVHYRLTFACQPGAKAIDIVDIGLPNDSYLLESAEASIGGNKLQDIRISEYVKPGVEVHLGEHAVAPGDSATLAFSIKLKRLLYADDQDPAYASFKFQPTWFGSEYVTGSTHLECHFVFPPGVSQNEARYHDLGFSESWYDSAVGAPVYRWVLSDARPDGKYIFGASFPAKYVEASSIQKPPGPLSKLILGLLTVLGAVFTFFLSTIFFWIPALIIFLAVRANRLRRMKYLPPTMAIEGTGIRRGLSTPEAAVLLELPLDRVMTLILFSLVRKGAAAVVARQPKLKVKIMDATLAAEKYEIDFLKALDSQGHVSQSKLQELAVDLVNSVNEKMRGYSRRDSVKYYRQLIEQCWDEARIAAGPEERSRLLEENYHWMTLDSDYPSRLSQYYGRGYYSRPLWWKDYYGCGKPGPDKLPAEAPDGRLSGPMLAEAIRNEQQSLGRDLVGNAEAFTSRVTAVTNPVPQSSGSSSGSSGRSSCACACACAGCACACAGGGR